MKQESLCADDFTVIQRYSDMVYRLAFSLVKNKYDAEDIHQEVFVRYLCKKPLFESAEHEKAWFLRVTINLCKNLWKTAWKQKFTQLDEADIANMPAENPPETGIIESVKKLPQKYRIVIHLFYYEELSVEEIAKLLHKKASTVRTQLTRARKKLTQLCIYRETQSN